MPTFNRHEMLLKAIQSIVIQDYENWELIIQDGKHHEKEEIAKIYESLPEANGRIIYVFNEQDNGIADAITKASKRITGDIVNWSNDDDLMFPGTLKFIAENIGDAKWCYGNIVDQHGNYYMGRQGNFEELKQVDFVPQPSGFITKEAFDKVNGFSKDFGSAADYEMWIKLWSHVGEPTYFNRTMAYYTVHPDMGTIKNAGEQQESAAKIREFYKNIHI